MTRLGLACIGLAACTASADQVSPPTDQFFFPTALAVTPDASRLFVTNANSELRYDSGTINVIDLDLVDQTVASWTTSQTEPSNCSPDPDHSETLICDETQFMLLDAGVRIGNFATALGVQDTGGGSLRLVAPTRGDPSITWIDYDGAKLQCNTSGVDFDMCDDDHRLSYIHNDPDVGYLPEEPFDVDVDSTEQFAVVTHLTTGDVTLVNSPIGGKATIADVVTGLFATDSSGVVGATGVATRKSADGDIVYVGARSEDRIQTFTVTQPVNGADPFLVQGNYFFLDAVGTNAGSSTDTRGMTFSSDGNRLYLLNRDPPSLQAYDTSLKASGFPADTGIGASDICREASTLTSVDTGAGERIYITCFSDGELYVVDPRGQTTIDDIISVGRGPYTVKASQSRKKVYVSNFLEDTIAVIDVDPGSKTRDRVVLRIGEVKPP